MYRKIGDTKSRNLQETFANVKYNDIIIVDNTMQKQYISHEEMEHLATSDQAIFVGRVGHQTRAVYRVGLMVYEQAIRLDDSNGSAGFFLVNSKRAEELLKIVK